MTKLPIKRANLNGKRRFVVYLSDIVNYIKDLTTGQKIDDEQCRLISIGQLKYILQTAKLRADIDYIYVPSNDDIALNIAATQAVLVLYGKITENCYEQQATWTMFNHLTDFVQGLKR